MIDLTHLSPDEARAAYYRLRDSQISERELQRAIVDDADRCSRLVFHDADLRKCPGCGRVNGDGRRRGFPDLVIPVPPILYVWELKTMRGKPSPEQTVWLDVLAKCERVVSGLITPADLSQVLEQLAGGKD